MHKVWSILTNIPYLVWNFWSTAQGSVCCPLVNCQPKFGGEGIRFGSQLRKFAVFAYFEEIQARSLYLSKCYYSICEVVCWKSNDLGHGGIIQLRGSLTNWLNPSLLLNTTEFRKWYQSLWEPGAFCNPREMSVTVTALGTSNLCSNWNMRLGELVSKEWVQHSMSGFYTELRNVFKSAISSWEACSVLMH